MFCVLQNGNPRPGGVVVPDMSGRQIPRSPSVEYGTDRTSGMQRRNGEIRPGSISTRWHSSVAGNGSVAMPVPIFLALIKSCLVLQPRAKSFLAFDGLGVRQGEGAGAEDRGGTVSVPGAFLRGG